MEKLLHLTGIDCGSSYLPSTKDKSYSKAEFKQTAKAQKEKETVTQVRGNCRSKEEGVDLMCVCC